MFFITAANDLQGNSESKSQSHPCCNTMDVNDFSPALTIAKVPTAPSKLLFEMCLREECQEREKKRGALRPSCNTTSSTRDVPTPGKTTSGDTAI